MTTATKRTARLVRGVQPGGDPAWHRTLIGGDSSNPTWDEYIDRFVDEAAPYLRAVRECCEREGIVGTTGIAGLTLGGGHGYLSRKYGLTIDNLIEAEVVLPDGSVVTANDQHQRDLFWALRGGGGNFGVVTRFSYRAQPVKEVYAGPIFWPFEAAADLMRFYRDFAPRAPRELCSFCGLKRIPTVDPFPVELRGRLTCALISCYVGSEADGQAALAPARAAMPPPWIDGMAMMPFPSLQGMFDPLMPPGLQWYWKGDFVRELPDAAIETHLRHGALIPENSLSLMHLYPIDGAVHDVASDATAWSARDVTWSMVIAGIDREPARFGTVARWAKDYWAATHPFSAGAAYLNFMMADEGQARVEATYGANYARLTALKAKYDPNNLLRVNHNIVPPAPAPSVERARELHPPL